MRHTTTNTQYSHKFFSLDRRQLHIIAVTFDRQKQMSKRELQDQALENSGVSYEESLLASQLTPTVYERLQEDGELCVYFKIKERTISFSEKNLILSAFLNL